MVAAVAGAGARDVTFLSGATEALNTVIRAYVGLADWDRKRIVTCATEHDAILGPSRYLCGRTGVVMAVLPVDSMGHVDLDELCASVEGTDGALVALMAANNEIGTLHPIREMAAMAHEVGASFLCDTTQAFGKRTIDVEGDDIDFASVSAHKIYGPKGAGALVARHVPGRLELQPLIIGGDQERGMRGGTVNVPGIVGLGEACRIGNELLEEETQRIEYFRDRLEHGILSQVPHTWVNGDRAKRLCNTTNIGFKGVDARTLIRDMHDIAVSTRSACSSGNSGPSHVLKAIGLSDEDAYSCIRFSLGRFTIQEEIDYAIGKVVSSVHKLRRTKSA